MKLTEGQHTGGEKGEGLHDAMPVWVGKACSLALKRIYSEAEMDYQEEVDVVVRRTGCLRRSGRLPGSSYTRIDRPGAKSSWSGLFSKL